MCVEFVARLACESALTVLPLCRRAFCSATCACLSKSGANRHQNRSEIVPKSSQDRAKIDPESVQNRPQIDPKIDPKSTPGPPGALGGVRAHDSGRVFGSSPPPKLTGGPCGIPKSAPENAAVSPGGVPGRPWERLGHLGDAPHAPRGEVSARLATRRAQSGVPERFRDDFRAISGRFSGRSSSALDTAGGVAVDSLRTGPALAKHHV